MSNRKPLKIGLIGFGVVGEGIYNVLSQTPSLNATIIKIGIKHIEKNRNAPAALFTSDINEILDNQEINCIVELIDDARVAYQIALKTFRNGKSLISANKKMIAEHLPALINVSYENKISFLYEGAVCGSIPVIRNLEEYYDNDLLQSFAGIVNGSTNYILTKMIEYSWTYDLALSQAQELGFAESNPSLDVDGIDAVNKLCIILKHTYGITCLPEQLLVQGITNIKTYDIQYAQEKSYKIKLVAQAIHVGDAKVAAWVLPTFVKSGDKLYNISDEYNGVVIGSKLADEQFLSGKGAGRYPTASAVLSDISALQYGYAYEYRKSKGAFEYTIIDQVLLKIYVSTDAKGHIEESIFENIEERFISKEHQYLVGSISIEALKQSPWLNNGHYSIILVGVAKNVNNEQVDVYVSELSNSII